MIVTLIDSNRNREIKLKERNGIQTHAQRSNLLPERYALNQILPINEIINIIDIIRLI